MLGLFCLGIGQVNAGILSYRINWFSFGLLPILRPSWLMLSVCLCCIVIVAGLVYTQIRLRRARASLEKESELYQVKIDFVANISHDAGTHLSLIDGPLDKSEINFTNDSSFEAGVIDRRGASGQIEKKFTVLLIEHNDEIRALEFGLLSESYHILEAVSGTDGLKMAFENIPDLILCDVVLPEQNGIEICSQLKADVRTSHIPIILLAGQSALFRVIQGLQAGADDYLVQPVDVSILLLKIQNMIKTRTAIRDYAGKTPSSGPDEWPNAGNNDEFIDKLRSLVIENISQPNFGVNEMAFQVGMSVSVLYRKVRSLTGMTVNDFMKTIKMQKALHLLESGAYQVNEVALMVGYESVRYFSNEFKKVYGKNPSKFRSISSEH